MYTLLSLFTIECKLHSLCYKRMPYLLYARSYSDVGGDSTVAPAPFILCYLTCICMKVWDAFDVRCQFI